MDPLGAKLGLGFGGSSSNPIGIRILKVSGSSIFRVRRLWVLRAS